MVIRVLPRIYALRCNSTRPGTRAASTPFSPSQHQTLQALHPWHCEGTSWGYSLWQSVYKHIFHRVFRVNETTSVSYIEPFYCSSKLCCGDLLVPNVRHRQSEVVRATAACGLVLAVPGEGDSCRVSTSRHKAGSDGSGATAAGVAPALGWWLPGHCSGAAPGSLVHSPLPLPIKLHTHILSCKQQALWQLQLWTYSRPLRLETTKNSLLDL